MIIVSIDPGLNGYICLMERNDVTNEVDIIATEAMPVKTILVKEAVYKYKHKNPKVLIKSGINKGKRARIIKIPKKTKREFDPVKFREIMFIWLLAYDIKALVTENTVIGIMSKGTMTGVKNIQMIKGILFGLGIIRQEHAHPSVWKKALGITEDKQTALDKVKELLPNFNVKSHDEAESFLIGYWWFLLEKK